MLAVAHRGYSSAYPENTALAHEKALAAGAECIETDVRLTRDGRPVCWHDPDLARVTGKALVVADLDFDALKAVALPQGQSVLALEEVLVIARGRARVMLDVKVATDAMIAAVLPLLAAAGMTENVMYSVRTLAHLESVRRHCGRIQLLGMPSDPLLADDYLRQGVQALRYWEDEASAGRVRQARDAGSEVWVTAGLRKQGEAPGYTTVDRVAALMRIGVAAVLLNDPGLVALARARPGVERQARG